MDEYQIISGHQWGLYNVPEHEVLISFNNDYDARAFEEWFYKNKKSFEKFADNYENF
ncbi:MAG: hypothetical protein PVG65_05570 [Candidatus Thorarchaeota archaeon]|jgi:hypothetical protein